MTRFEALLDLVVPGRPMWDVGCDHGLVGLRALAEGRVPFVTFVDAAPGVIERLEARIPASQRARCRTAAQKGEELDWTGADGSLVLAGLGNNTIARILSAIPAATLRNLRVVVCCENRDEELRLWLRKQGFRLVPGGERLCLQGGRYRLAFAVTRESGDELQPFGNGVFATPAGQSYLRAKLNLWRSSLRRQQEHRERYQELLALERRYGG